MPRPPTHHQLISPHACVCTGMKIRRHAIIPSKRNSWDNNAPYPSSYGIVLEYSTVVHPKYCSSRRTEDRRQYQLSHNGSQKCIHDHFTEMAAACLPVCSSVCLSVCLPGCASPIVPYHPTCRMYCTSTWPEAVTLSTLQI